jgi:hypothetical protein
MVPPKEIKAKQEEGKLKDGESICSWREKCGRSEALNSGDLQADKSQL